MTPEDLRALTPLIYTHVTPHLLICGSEEPQFNARARLAINYNLWR